MSEKDSFGKNVAVDHYIDAGFIVNANGDLLVDGITVRKDEVNEIIQELGGRIDNMIVNELEDMKREFKDPLIDKGKMVQVVQEVVRAKRRLNIMQNTTEVIQSNT